MDIHVSVKPETLFSIGPLNVTNSFLMMIIMMTVIVLVGWLIARKAQVIPGRAQSAFEMTAEFLLNIVESTAGKRGGRRVFPLVGALFFYIILANYSGLLPGAGTVGIWEHEAATPAETAQIASAAQPADSGVTLAQDEPEGEKVLKPFLRSPSADLNMTLAMALVTFVIVQIAGIQAHGLGGRFKHMADPPFIFPIELVSELARIISLSFRLFGNIFAGEVLVLVMYSMSSALLEKTKYIAFVIVGLPVIFLFLELLFGFIQALVFALLSLAYIAIAVGGHDEHEAHGESVPAAAPAGGD